MPGDELVELGLQERTVLAHRPGDLGVRAQDDVRVKLQLGQHLGPELRQVVVHDDVLDEPGVGHLEQVLVLEVVRREPNPRRLLAALGQVGVQLLDALVVDRSLPNEDFLVGKIVHGGDRRGIRTRDDDLGDVRRGRFREVHLLQALGGHRQGGRRDVPAPVEEGRRQLVAADRDEGDEDPQVAGLVLLVELVLEHLEGFVGDAAGRALVDEVVRLVVHDQDADVPALLQGVEVAALFADAEGQGVFLFRACPGAAFSWPAAGAAARASTKRPAAIGRIPLAETMSMIPPGGILLDRRIAIKASSPTGTARRGRTCRSPNPAVSWRRSPRPA